MNFDKETIQKAAFDWLKTKPWHVGMIGGYADLYHSPDEELEEFAGWFTRMMFDVLSFADGQDYEETPKQPCNCHDTPDSPVVVGTVPVDMREDGES